MDILFDENVCFFIYKHLFILHDMIIIFVYFILSSVFFCNNSCRDEHIARNFPLYRNYPFICFWFVLLNNKKKLFFIFLLFIYEMSLKN